MSTCGGRPKTRNKGDNVTSRESCKQASLYHGKRGREKGEARSREEEGDKLRKRRGTGKNK